MIKAILLDVGGTLIEVNPSVGHVYASVACRHGIDISPEELNQRFRTSWKKFKFHSRSYKREWWRLVVMDTFHSHRSENFEELFSEIYEAFTFSSAWRIFPDVEPVLSELKRRGIILAVASNWDERLPALLKTLELEQYFAHQFISCQLQRAKPDPEFFRHALDTLKLSAHEVLHIGDDEENDYLAPQKVSIRGFLINRKNHQDDGPVLSSLNALIEKVEASNGQ